MPFNPRFWEMFEVFSGHVHYFTSNHMSKHSKVHFEVCETKLALFQDEVNDNKPDVQ
jgi:hypothetical protein